MYVCMYLCMYGIGWDEMGGWRARGRWKIAWCAHYLSHTAPYSPTYPTTHLPTQVLDDVNAAFDLCTAACLVPVQSPSASPRARSERIDPAADLDGKVAVTTICMGVRVSVCDCERSR